MDAVGMTSRLVAASREWESSQDNRLFNDPFAGALAGDEGRAFMTLLETVPRHGGVPAAMKNPYLPIRTLFLDDVIRKAAQDGVRQFAILAAGMDARAFRLDWPADATVFEVERPEVFEYKESVLKEIGATPRVKRVIVEIDLRDDFAAAMRAAGFVSGERTLFITEGLLPYLPDEGVVLALLKKVALLAAPGSCIALDTVGDSLLKAPMTKAFLELMARVGAPWLYGTDEPESLMERAGFTGVHAVQPGEYRPDRWPFPAVPRSVPGLPRSYFVTAVRP